MKFDRKMALSCAVFGAVTVLAPFQAMSATTVIAGSIDFGNGTNYFDASNGFVPAGYGNSGGSTSVAVGDEIEFGIGDAANLDTADFTNGSLTISDLTYDNADAGAFVMTFTADTAGFFNNLSLVSDDFGGTFSIVGNTLTFNGTGVDFQDGDLTRKAVFSFGAASVPEPATWGMMILGFGVIGAAARRQRAKVSFQI